MKIKIEIDYKYKLNNVLYSYKELEEKHSKLMESFSLAQDKNGGEYWAWQGDGYDHLESLTCPVLIPANVLRQLLDDVFTQGLIEGYKIQKKYTF